MTDSTAEVDELLASIRDYAAGGYEVDRVVASACACGSETFRLLLNDEEGVAARLCTACDEVVALADSDEHIDDVEEVDEAECTCGNDVFRVGVGFALTGDGEVRWVSVGLRCTDDGVAGVYADWKIDYVPSRHLLEQV